jgi:hypothetical protein
MAVVEKVQDSSEQMEEGNKDTAGVSLLPSPQKHQATYLRKTDVKTKTFRTYPKIVRGDISKERDISTSQIRDPYPLSQHERLAEDIGVEIHRKAEQ